MLFRYFGLAQDVPTDSKKEQTEQFAFFVKIMSLYIRVSHLLLQVAMVAFTVMMAAFSAKGGYDHRYAKTLRALVICGESGIEPSLGWQFVAFGHGGI